MTAFAVPSDNIGPRPSEQPQPPPSPTLPETFGAAFGLYNPSVAMWQHGRDQNARGSFAPVEGYNAWDDIKDKPEYLPHAAFFAGSRSSSETQALKDRIDQQKEDERIYAASGPIGTVAGFMAGTLDPTLLLPGRIAISALKEGRPFIRSALETSAGAVSQTATQDMILRAAQPDKPVAETVLSVASATILGAVLGPAAKYLSPSERARLVAGLDHERALNDAHVSGLPAAEQVTAPATSTEPVSLKLTSSEKTERGKKTRTWENYEFSVGDRKGEAQIRIDSDEPNVAYVEDVRTPEGANAVGPKSMRAVMQQFQEAHPEIDTFRARRISGARVGGRTLSEDEALATEYTDFAAPRREPAAASLREQARAAKGDVPEMERIQRQEVAQALPQTQATSRGFKLPLAGDKGAIEFDVDHDLVTITGAHLAEEERGKGIAFQGYKGIVDWALSTGRSVRSIGAPSADAARIYEGLGKAGYSVERAPDEAGRIGYQIKPPEAAQEAPAIARAAGAAAADVRSLESLTLAPAYGLTSKFAGFLGKTIAAMNRMSLASRKGYADLVELSLLTKGNIPRQVDMRTGEEIARGEPPRYQLQPGETAAHGGAPLESIAATQMKATTSQIRDELLNQWMDLAFGGAEQAPRFALSRSGLATVTEGRFGGLPADKPTFEEFGKMVSQAIRDNNVHDIPQVQKAAETVSRDVFDKWGARAEAAIVGFKRAEQAEGEGYFPHVWNTVKIAADRFNFVNQLTDRFMADQAAKLQAQGRIRAYRNSLDVNEQQIAKLTRRMEKKQADLEEDEALREEVSKINKFAYRRAEALREGEFINVGGVAVPVPGKNIQKARGGAPFETVARARINELADRASGVANEIAEIDEKLLAAHFQSVEMRGKIEDELGKWQGKSAAEAKSALKARAKYEAERDAAREAKEGGYGARAAREERKLGRVASADKAVDDAVDRILGKNYDRPREDIRDRVQETTNRILSSPDGRLPYDESAVPNFGTPSAALPSYRGSLAERALNVSNKFAAPWIEDNIERVVQNHLRTFVPDVLLSERFGDMEMSNVFRDINRDYEALSDAAKGNSKQQKAIEKDRQGAIRDLAATRDMFRGLYNYSADAVDQKMARLSANLRNANVPMNMANSLTSSLGDATGSIFRFGLMNTFRDSFFPYFRSLATDQKYNKEVARQAKAWGITDDYERATRHRSLSGVAEDFVPQSPVERFLAWSADKTQIASGLAAWTDWIKTRHATVVMAEIYRAGKAVERGSATEKQLTLLAASNIEPDMAIRIAKFYETSGNRSDGVLLPNTADWKGPGADQAKEAFVSALHREVNLAVVTPGLDRPLWMAKPMLALLGQYKSFVMAATTRIMIANLQRSDGQTLQGLIAAIGLGMLGYKINSLTGGQPTSDNPMDWVKEGMSRANIFGVMEEFNSMASKMTRGQADMYRVIGATKPLSRYQALSSVDMLLGPTVGKLRDLSRITGGVATGDLDAGDIKAARRFIFLQNAPYFRGLFNEVETGVNNAFGIPQQAPRRQ
jgi:hypothetical protein